MAKSELYQEYLRVIGKLKDVHGLTVDVEHEDIHTFIKGKQVLFKLFFGQFTQDSDPSIVISFHIDLYHHEAIIWFVNTYRIYPSIQVHDSFIEDSAGETYLGADAMALKETYQAQEILNKWLDGSSEEEMEEFVNSEVRGREPNPRKSFDSRREKDEAIIEFNRLRKPPDDDQVH